MTGLGLTLAAIATRAATEAELRAAVIYNIARFVQWPHAATTSNNFDFCTLGNNPVSDALTSLENKPINNMKSSVRAIRRDNDLQGCKVLYIASEDAVRMGAIAEIISRNHEATLTISDAPSFLALGGMVQLVVVDDRQRFRINQDLAEKFGLNINAKLLQLALPRD